MRKLIWFLGGVAVVLLLATSLDTNAATPAGTFDDVCADCHEASDFSGEPVKEVEASLAAITKGTLKHKGKITLTPAEITAMAAFLTK
jgi:mono/diheme cytochrome c family protein